MQIRVKENPEEFGRCGCGRSPTGQCCGWHGLTEEQYQDQLKNYKQMLEVSSANNLQEPK